MTTPYNSSGYCFGKVPIPVPKGISILDRLTVSALFPEGEDPKLSDTSFNVYGPNTTQVLDDPDWVSNSDVGVVSCCGDYPSILWPAGNPKSGGLLSVEDGYYKIEAVVDSEGYEDRIFSPAIINVLDSAYCDNEVCPDCQPCVIDGPIEPFIRVWLSGDTYFDVFESFTDVTAGTTAYINAFMVSQGSNSARSPSFCFEVKDVNNLNRDMTTEIAWSSLTLIELNDNLATIASVCQASVSRQYPVNAPESNSFYLTADYTASPMPIASSNMLYYDVTQWYSGCDVCKLPSKWHAEIVLNSNQTYYWDIVLYPIVCA